MRTQGRRSGIFGGSRSSALLMSVLVLVLATAPGVAFGEVLWSPQVSGTTANLTCVDFWSATVGWTVGENGTILYGQESLPVHRFYNFKKGVHFYTASEGEKANVIATLSSTYRHEGIGFYLGN